MLHLKELGTVSDRIASSPALGAMGWLRSWTVELRRRKLQRDAFATLLKVDDDILQDVVGLRRDQVERAARLPLTVDAARAVRLMQDVLPSRDAFGRLRR